MTPDGEQGGAAPPASCTLRSIRLTRFGWAFFGTLAPLLLLGFWFGGPLLLVPALGLALLWVAAFVAFVALRSVEVGAPESRTVFAREELQLEFPIRNRSRLFPLRDLEWIAGDEFRPQGAAGGYLPSLPQRESATGRVWHAFRRRGEVDAVGLMLRTTFPFGLFVARAEFEVPADLLVLPSLGSLRSLEGLLAPLPDAQELRRSTRRGENELFGLREWRPGESQRGVLWKRSAGLGRMIVRQNLGEDRPGVHLLLDTRAVGRPTRGGWMANFDRAVDLCATLVEALLREGVRLRLDPFGDDSGLEGPGELRAQVGLARALRFLARVEPVPVEGWSFPRRALRSLRRTDEVVILVTAQGPEAKAIGGGVLDGVRVLDVDRESLSKSYRGGGHYDAAQLTVGAR